MTAADPDGLGSLESHLRDVGVGSGLDAVGITDTAAFPATQRALRARRDAGHHAGMSFTFRDPVRSTSPDRLLRHAASLVVGIRGYAESTADRPADSAAVARYARRDHYAVLREGLEEIAAVLRARGHRGSLVVDQNGLVDRAAAHRAGLGWWGKNSNLLRPGMGSWFVIGSVVTDAALAPTGPAMADGCGSCSACRSGCPTDAIVADGVIDGRRCLAWLVQRPGIFPRAHRIVLGDRLYGCDDCQQVCPPGRVYIRVAEDQPPATVTADETWVPVLDILSSTDDELLGAYGRWYIPRREPRYLRRNAVIILGNIGNGANAQHRAAVDRLCADSDPLLRSHAVWAAARLGLVDLVASCRDDADALVRAEVALASAVPLAAGAVRAEAVSIVAHGPLVADD